MIYVIEGADGTGKSTLAEKIAQKLNGQVIHCIYRSDIDMYQYHSMVMHFAISLGIPVILDRWAPSENVYGSVFRNGESYDVDGLIQFFLDRAPGRIKWVYCTNKNVVENHKRNMQQRHELYDDMTLIDDAYDRFVRRHSQLDWFIYDFDNTDTDVFIETLTRQEP